MSDNIKDLVIIGAGPAGLSASIYGARSLLDAETLEQESIGGQTVLTSEIDNYPGVPHTDGFTLSDAMRSQAEDLGATIRPTLVEHVERVADGTFRVATSDGDLFAKTVILAGGATPRRAGFANEETFRGRGVSYCATCDAMFFRGKEVYVVGGGNSAAEEALFLTKFASKVTMVVRKDHLRAQAVVAKAVEDNEKIEVLYKTRIVGVDGEDLLSEVVLEDVDTGARETRVSSDGSYGVFVFVGRVPASELVGDLVELDEQGYVVTDERMATRTPGLFAAGDVRRTPLRQVITAAADGAIAATSCAAYLGQPIEG